MQAPQDPLGGGGFVVLHKFLVNPGFRVDILLVGFHEVSPGIPEDLGLDDHHAGELCFLKGKRHYRSASFRYRRTASCHFGRGVNPASASLDLSSLEFSGRAALLSPYSAVVTGITSVSRPYCL